LALLLVSGGAAAQQTGTVTGEVTDRSTGQPLNGVQVSVRNTTRGGISDARGRFVIPGVPTGTYTVEAVFIGYRTETQQVTVGAGEPATANFQLGITAVSLDEVIVTGTGGATARRQLGASVASVDVAKIQDKVPVADVGTVLQARIPGLRSITTAGGVGAAKDLRIRGVHSLSLGQRPVIYVDGVRIDARQTEWGTGACCAFSGGAGEDRLSDLNPNDIDRIEVIKGPAAGTLYGSEGSNGVIQIFTKKGRSDSAPRWTVGLTTGFQRYRENFPTTFYPRFIGPDPDGAGPLSGFRALDPNESLVENGLYQGYDVTVQGGGSSFTYFVSGGFLDEQGSIQPNWQKRGNLRVNTHWLASQKVSFDVTSAYTRSRIASLQSGNNWTALLGNAMLGGPYNARDCVAGSVCAPPGPYGEPWVSVPAIQEIDTFDDANRWMGGMTMTYSQSDRISHKVQFGLDAVNEEKLRFYPWGLNYVYVGNDGEKDLGYRNSRIITADYLGTLKLDISSRISSQLSAGAQAFWDEERRNFAVGEGFAGPGVSTVTGAILTYGRVNFREVIQVGGYGQGRFAFDDKLFVTAGVRVDGNSAFGDNYGLQVYPNAQLSYDLSQENFTPDFFSTLRLRGAIGQTGRAPGAFDKFLVFSPLTVLDDEPGVRPSNPGNQDLKPEITTEFEGGFEASLLNDRIGMDFTYYKSTTQDLIAEVQVPPSANFGGNPNVNIGELQNWGWEATFRVTPIETQRLRWSADLRMDHNENEITDLGRDPVSDTVIQIRGNNNRLGLPRLGVRQRVVTGFDRNLIRHTRSDTTLYIGPQLPTFNLSLGNELTFGAFRLYGLLTHESGAWFDNGGLNYQNDFRTGDQYLGLLDYSKCRADGRCVETEMRTFQSDSLFDYANRLGDWDKRDNIRIREISLSYNVAQSLSGKLGLGASTITFSAKNLTWWDDCRCMDPNMNWQGGEDFAQGSGFLAMPAARQFLLSFRTSFGGN
jgi:TonB-dependent SusC/RagA subfamily outer membrane receptor